MSKTIRWVLLVMVLPVMAACASFPETVSLERYDKTSGYRYALLDNSGNGDDLFIILTFSGGGTRAAALSYGVLEKLRDVTIEVDGEQRNLLAEVDVISSISGGSFTAAYYGLFGDDIFADGGKFQEDFLYNNVQDRLVGALFNPYNWGRLASPTFGRIELATELYQQLLFGDATYADLSRRGQKPFLMVNATDMVKGTQFMFIQEQLDPMCADLGSVAIARAVAASSNFPIAFSPLTLNSYPGQCDYVEPGWVNNALQDVQSNPRRYYRARTLRDYQDPRRRYAHLLDGGVADNIGLRGPLTSTRSTDPAWSVLRMMNLEEIEKLVYIVVDARNETPNQFDASPSAPGLAAVVSTIATTPMVNYSFDTLELIKDRLRSRANAQRDQPDLFQVEMYRVYVGFDQIRDEAERYEFLTIPTSFKLPREQVDALRKKGGELLEQSPCFQVLVAPSPSQPPNTCL